MLSRTCSAPCAGTRDPTVITAVARTARLARWAGRIITPVCRFEDIPRRIPLSFETSSRGASLPAGDGPFHRPGETRYFGEDSAVADFCASPKLGRIGQINGTSKEKLTAPSRRRVSTTGPSDLPMEHRSSGPTDRGTIPPFVNPLPTPILGNTKYQYSILFCRQFTPCTECFHSRRRFNNQLCIERTVYGAAPQDRADMSEWETFESILASLHEAAIDPDGWPDASGLIDRVLGTYGSTLACGDGGSEEDYRLYFLWTCLRGRTAP